MKIVQIQNKEHTYNVTIREDYSVVKSDINLRPEEKRDFRLFYYNNGLPEFKVLPPSFLFPKHYLPSEKLEYMLEKNPSLQTLINKFKLEHTL